MNRKYWAIAVALLAGVLTVIAGAWRLRGSGVPQTSRSGGSSPSSSYPSLHDQGRAAFAQLEMSAAIPVMATRESVADWIARTEQSGAAPWPAARQEVVGEAAAFIYWRFGQSSADAYWAWRSSTGMIPKSLEQLRLEWQVDENYKELFGAPPASAEVKPRFDRFWAGALDAVGGSARPSAVPTGKRPDGSMVLTFSSIRNPGESGDVLGTTIPDSLLLGNSSATLRGWFNPPRAIKDLVKSGPIRAATVVVVLEFGDGGRRPLILRFFHDPTDKRWRLWAVNQTQLGGQPIGPLEY